MPAGRKRWNAPVVNVHGDDPKAREAAAIEISRAIAAQGAAGRREAVALLHGRRWELTERARGAEVEMRPLAERLLDGSFSSARQIVDANARQLREAAAGHEYVVACEPLADALAHIGDMSETRAASVRRDIETVMGEFASVDVLVGGPQASPRAAAVLDALGVRYMPWSPSTAAEAAQAARDARQVAVRSARERGPLNSQPGPGSGPEKEEEAGRVRPAESAPGAGEMGEANMAEENVEQGKPREYVNVSIPKEVFKGKPSARNIVVNGDPLVKVKLPPRVPEVQTPDGPLDVSGYTFLARPTAVKDWPNDPSYISVGFPAANADGEPWGVNLMKNQGHWENPDGQSREELGKWVKTGEPLKARVEAEELRRVMEDYRQERRDYAVEAQAKSRIKELGPERAAVAEAGAGKFDQDVARKAAEIAAAAKARRAEMPERKADRPEGATARGDAAMAKASAGAQAREAPRQTQAVAR